MSIFSDKDLEKIAENNFDKYQSQANWKQKIINLNKLTRFAANYIFELAKEFPKWATRVNLQPIDNSVLTCEEAKPPLYQIQIGGSYLEFYVDSIGDLYCYDRSIKKCTLFNPKLVTDKSEIGLYRFWYEIIGAVYIKKNIRYNDEGSESYELHTENEIKVQIENTYRCSLSM